MELQNRFQDFLEQHKKILYKICNSYCRNPDDREDLAQQIVAQLWQSFRSFDGRVAFSTWMYRVALNVAISWYRRERTRTQHIVPAGERLLEVAGESDTQSDDIRLLYELIGKLDELNKALILFYLDGNSNREIARCARHQRNQRHYQNQPLEKDHATGNDGTTLWNSMNSGRSGRNTIENSIEQ